MHALFVRPKTGAGKTGPFFSTKFNWAFHGSLRRRRPWKARAKLKTQTITAAIFGECEK